MHELNSRGVEDLLTAIVDGLTRISHRLPNAGWF
jgi:hypothetical protein